MNEGCDGQAFLLYEAWQKIGLIFLFRNWQHWWFGMCFLYDSEVLCQTAVGIVCFVAAVIVLLVQSFACLWRNKKKKFTQTLQKDCWKRPTPWKRN